MDEQIRITDEEITKMQRISPSAVPLNPSVQGWSGQKVREYLSKYIFDAQDGLISKINGKMSVVSEGLDKLSDIETTLNNLNLDGFVTEEEAQMIKNEAFPHIGETPPDTTVTKIWFDTRPEAEFIDIEDVADEQDTMEEVNNEPFDEMFEAQNNYQDPEIFNEFFEPLFFDNSNNDNLSFDNNDEILSFESNEQDGLTFEEDDGENLTFEN